MAKSLTIKNKNNLILYPKTVSSLVYDNSTGNTVKQDLDNLIGQVVELLGIDNAFFGGIVGTSTDITTDYTNNGYSGPYLYMVGADMASLVAYQYNGSGSPTQLFGGTTYDFTDYSEVKQEVVQLSQEIDENLPVLRQLIIPSVLDVTTVTSYATSGKGWTTYQKNVGATYSSPYSTNNNANVVCDKFTFSAGDTIKVWGKGTGVSAIWLTLNENDVIKAKSTNGGRGSNPSSAVEESSPEIINPTYDGTLLVSSLTSVDYGVIIEHTIPAELKIASSEQDGLMSKEVASIINDEFITLIDDIKQTSYVEEISITFDNVNKEYKNYQTGAVGTIWTPSLNAVTGRVCAKCNVVEGDSISIWGRGTGTGSLYAITDEDDIVRDRNYGGKGAEVTAFTQENPLQIVSEYTGTLYLNSFAANDYGAIILRTHEGAKRATKTQDGLMTKEQVSIMETLSAALENQTGGLSNKLIAVIGDSFSAPNSWQTTMNGILGSTTYKVAVSGGRWASTDPATDAYNQALKLVSDFANFEKKPDYILCVLGVNDVNNNVTIGDIVYTDIIGSGGIDYSSFTGGIQAVLTVLKQNFPQAIIKVGFTPAGMMYLAASQTIEERTETYLNRLQKVANLYGVDYIETRACGICRIVSQEFDMFKSDGHPNSAGYVRIGQYMARLMLSNL